MSLSKKMNLSLIRCDKGNRSNILLGEEFFKVKIIQRESDISLEILSNIYSSGIVNELDMEGIRKLYLKSP